MLMIVQNGKVVRGVEMSLALTLVQRLSYILWNHDYQFTLESLSICLVLDSREINSSA